MKDTIFLMKRFGGWCFRLSDVVMVEVWRDDPLSIRVHVGSGLMNPIFEGEEAEKVMEWLMPGGEQESYDGGV